MAGETPALQNFRSGAEALMIKGVSIGTAEAVP
jgi:hypothetical protein